MQEFQVLRVLEPILRMKAQVDSSSRGQKDFICREEQRKTAWWSMQGDPETSGPLGQIGDFYSPFCILPQGGVVSLVQTEVS
jgi:hypothetical protein